MDSYVDGMVIPDEGSDRAHTAGRTLIQLAHVVVRLEDRALTRELGLSYRQMRILKHIDAGITSGTELGKIFGVTAPAISETLESLVRKNLVAREPHDTDRRAVRLVLTRAGSELNARAHKVEIELSQHLLGPLTEDDIENLLDLAHRVLVPSQETLITRRLSQS
ncbi:MAG: MarR family transcriptional regulator [Microbacteriaceae bacterium]|nr:MarR family transcriptional regulator [Microbacteriaceae bacterium]